MLRPAPSKDANVLGKRKRSDDAETEMMKAMGLPTGFDTSRQDWDEQGEVEESEGDDVEEVSIQEILKGEPPRKKQKRPKKKRNSWSSNVAYVGETSNDGNNPDMPSYCLYCKIPVSDKSWSQHALGKKHMNKLKCDMIKKAEPNTPYVWCLCCGMLVPPNAWDSHQASKKHKKQNLAGEMYPPPDETQAIGTEFSERGGGTRHCNLCKRDVLEDNWVDHICERRHKTLKEIWTQGCKVGPHGKWTAKYLKDQRRKKKEKSKAKGRGRGRGGIGHSSRPSRTGGYGYMGSWGSPPPGYGYSSYSGTSWSSRRKFGDGFKKKKKTATIGSY